MTHLSALPAPTEALADKSAVIRCSGSIETRNLPAFKWNATRHRAHTRRFLSSINDKGRTPCYIFVDKLPFKRRGINIEPVITPVPSQSETIDGMRHLETETPRNVTGRCHQNQPNHPFPSSKRSIKLLQRIEASTRASEPINPAKNHQLKHKSINQSTHTHTHTHTHDPN